MRIFNSPDGNMTVQNKTIPWHNNTVVFYDVDNSAPLTTADFMAHAQQVFYRNQSEYHSLQPEFDLNFYDCYLVEMELKYDEIYGPLTAFGVIVHQIVVLDQNLVPIWIGIAPFHWIS